MSGLPVISSGHSACRLEAGLQHFRSENSGQRFTLDGSAALEKRLALFCEQILAEVQLIIPIRKLEALVLGGGYGRGEGGVLRTPAGDEPYNDLEFYVFLRGKRILNEHRYGAALDALGGRLSPDAGLHVEFKVDSFARFRRSPVTMFSYDLLAGHRILFAPEGSFAGCKHHLDPGRIPLHEATRLLFNRCTGLLFVKELLRHNHLTGEQSDFIGRNLAKAQLALGDVVLTAAGQYHWSCLERHERLKQLVALEKPPWGAEVESHHAAGKDFKLRPSRASKTPRQFLTEFLSISDLARQLWLWLEGRRLSRPFASVRDYALSSLRKCPECSFTRALALNIRTFGPGVVFDPQALRYPREALLNALSQLLWEDSLNDLRTKRLLQKQLRTGASDWHSFVAAYKSVWPRFN
jgi:hypothetical protein